MRRDNSSGFVLPYTLIVLAVISLIASAGLISLNAISDRELALIGRTNAMFEIESRKALQLYEAIAIDPSHEATDAGGTVFCMQRDEASFIRPWRLDTVSASRIMQESDVHPSQLIAAYRGRYADQGGDDTQAPVTLNLFDLRQMPAWRDLDHLWSEGIALTELSMHGSASFHVPDASAYALGVVFGLDENALRGLQARIEAGAVRSISDLSVLIPGSDVETGVLAPEFTFAATNAFSLFLASEYLLFGSRFVYEIEPNGLTAPFREIDSLALDAAALKRLGDLGDDGNDIPTPWRCVR